ncbi:MAG: TonB-dependent receptor [Deltaproteobacteria bacterium]|jgi:iron complex outermembrane receptor protein|nr:TonB-dependent receptor [Deltaproteobacteria bacterium]
MLRKILPIFLCSLLTVTAIPAAAQVNDGQQRVVLEPIRVTAQKREENIQEISVAVSVISERGIEEKGIKQFQDLSAIAPNLYITTSGGAATYTYVGIRGRTNNSSGGDIDPTVTVMLDGVPYDDFLSLASIPMFDIERVEVLRGPQSTLYGFNSEAGVINIISKKPGRVPRANFNLTYRDGQRSDGSWSVQGGVSAPIIQDKLAIGLSFSGIQDGSYIKNLARPDKDFASEKRSGLRFSAVLTPNDSFEAVLNFGYTQVRSKNAYLALPVNEEAAKELLWPTYKKWEVYNDFDDYAKIDNYTGDLKLTFKTDYVDIVSITGFRKSDQIFDSDMDFSYAPLMGGFGAHGLAKIISKTFVQELRFLSPEDKNSSLTWLLGLFYRNSVREGDMSNGLTFNGQAVPPMMTLIDSTLKLVDMAIFGQGTYRVLDDKLGFTLGVRQEWTNRELTDRINMPGLKPTKTDSQFLPKFSLDYRLTPDNMIYATVVKGWRPGGFYNMETPYSFESLDTTKFNRETSWTYEIGSKNAFLDNNLFLNLALFYTKYKGYQDLAQLSLWGAHFVNAGTAEVYGFELDGQMDINDIISANFSFGYLKPKYKSYKTLTGDFSGNVISGVPKYNGAIGVNFKFLDGFYIYPEARFRGKTYWDRANLYSQNAFTTLHLRAGYITEHWELYLFGNNLTNKYAFTQAMNMGTGEKFGPAIRPLEIGMGFNFSY